MAKRPEIWPSVTVSETTISNGGTDWTATETVEIVVTGQSTVVGTIGFDGQGE